MIYNLCSQDLTRLDEHITAIEERTEIAYPIGLLLVLGKASVYIIKPDNRYTALVNEFENQPIPALLRCKFAIVVNW